jgi:prophage antirepressor-like protein
LERGDLHVKQNLPVPEEWRVVTSVVTSFGEKDTHCLTEQGLYFFLGRSDKPKALPFQKWVAGEILPAIRKRGAYVTSAKVEEFRLSLENLIRLASAWQKDREAKDLSWKFCMAKVDATTEQVAQLEKQIRLLQEHKDTVSSREEPKSESTAAVENTENASAHANATSLPRKKRSGKKNDGIAMRDLASFIRLDAKCYVGANSLYQYLRDNGYLNNTKKRWNKPSEHSLCEGLFRESHYRQNSYIVTQKGLNFFSELFRNKHTG